MDKIEELFLKLRNLFSTFSVGGCHGYAGGCHAEEMVESGSSYSSILIYTIF